MLHKLPVTNVEKARHPVIDMHAHPRYARTAAEIDRWVEVMDADIERREDDPAHGRSPARSSTGWSELYSRHAGGPLRALVRLRLHGLRPAGLRPRGGPGARALLQGAQRGVGEEGDKGLGMQFGRAKGLHFDDARLAPLLERCGELGLPISIHVADPIWMYQPMDETNDGMMNAVKWRLDDKPGIVDHGQDGGGARARGRAAIRVPVPSPATSPTSTTTSTSSATLLDRLPNLYADFAARFAESARHPPHRGALLRALRQPCLAYGTDMGASPDMYRLTFRILETLDEHILLGPLLVPLELLGAGARARAARAALPRERAGRSESSARHGTATAARETAR